MSKRKMSVTGAATEGGRVGGLGGWEGGKVGEWEGR